MNTLLRRVFLLNTSLLMPNWLNTFKAKCGLCCCFNNWWGWCSLPLYSECYLLSCFINISVVFYFGFLILVYFASKTKHSQLYLSDLCFQHPEMQLCEIYNQLNLGHQDLFVCVRDSHSLIGNVCRKLMLMARDAFYLNVVLASNWHWYHIVFDFWQVYRYRMVFAFGRELVKNKAD